MKSRIPSLTDVLTLSLCGIVLGSILVTGVVRHRAVARQASCADNLKRLGLATHNYHAVYRQLPMGCGGTSIGSADQPLLGNANRLSPFVGLLPFMEQQAVWEKISNPYQNGSVTFPSMGPVPWYDASSYEPWGMRPESLVCPTDSEDAQRFVATTSYAINYGDGIVNVGAALNKNNREYTQGRAVHRGAFQPEIVLRFRDFLDGLSNTVFMSERRIGGPRVAKDIDRLVALNPSLCIAASEDSATQYWPEGRNARWADGSLLSIGFQTILPPNSPSATTTAGELEGVMSVSSNHAEGAHLLFADGAVKYATNSIDAGDSTRPSVAWGTNEGYAPAGSMSPYGLWGALGTRANRETIVPDEDNLIAPPVELSAEDVADLEAKPLQTWTYADDGKTFQARFLGLQRNTRVSLFTEEGKQILVPLSDLKSEDAYRAIEQFMEEKLEMRRTMISQLEEAVGLLDQRKVGEFVRLFFDGEPNADTIAAVTGERGLLIQQLELALAAFRSPSPTASISLNATGDTFRVRTKGPVRGDIRFQRFGGRWKIVK